MRAPQRSLALCLLAAAALIWLLAWTGAAQAHGRPQFTPEIGSQIDLGMVFTDSEGISRTLERVLDGRPGLILLGYNRCRNLCPTAQRVVADALPATGLAPDQYRILFVSIDMNETPDDAAAAKTKLAASGAGSLESWRFLTGEEEAIGTLLAQLGATVERRDRIDEFVHPVALMALTPHGRLARVLSGFAFEPRDLRLALVEASAGRLGSLFDQVVLLCAGYDSTMGQYTPVIQVALRAASVVMLMILGGGILLLVRRRPA